MIAKLTCRLGDTAEQQQFKQSNTAGAATTQPDKL
jgi:hypothetical protein